MSSEGLDTPLLQAIGVGKRYIDGPREIEVLHDLNLEVAAGDLVAVVGASGVGKSTLLHLLGTLDRPSAGRILVDGHDVFALRGAALAEFRNRTVGFVFQFHQLLADFTALENVMMAGMIGRESTRVLQDRAGGLLDRVGLGERLHHRPGELSGGEQQRVAVARAVMRRPRLILADEPTGNLDPETGRLVQEILLDLNRECGAALVVATHNAQLAAMMTRVVQLREGRLTAEPATGTVERMVSEVDA